jgi:hypothetical protein
MAPARPSFPAVSSTLPLPVGRVDVSAVGLVGIADHEV